MHKYLQSFFFEPNILFQMLPSQGILVFRSLNKEKYTFDWNLIGLLFFLFFFFFGKIRQWFMKFDSVFEVRFRAAPKNLFHMGFYWMEFVDLARRKLSSPRIPIAFFALFLSCKQWFFSPYALMLSSFTILRWPYFTILIQTSLLLWSWFLFF